MAALVRIHTGGARVVLTSGLRLSRDTFGPAFKALEVAALPPRELVGLAMRHLHSWTSSLLADASGTSDNPTAMYWPVRSGDAIDGILMRSFILHPLLVDPVRRTVLPGGPIDSHYVRDCCPDRSQIHIVDDSDELAVFEMSPDGRIIGNQVQRRGVSILRLAAVAAKCNHYQRSYWQRPIRVHARELGDAWRAAEHASAAITRKIRRCRPIGPALVTMFEVLRDLRRRRDKYETGIRRMKRRYGRARHQAGKAWARELKRLRRRTALFGR
jgi:hypothetical protein